MEPRFSRRRIASLLIIAVAAGRSVGGCAIKADESIREPSGSASSISVSPKQPSLAGRRATAQLIASALGRRAHLRRHAVC